MRILRRREGSSEYVETLLDDELAQCTMTPPDRALCQELVYGITRWRATLDWLVARKTSNRQQAQTLRLLLHLGLYQLFWLQRIPNHAAVHETVELGKQLGFGPQAGFLNAVLRGYSRERDATVAALEALKKDDHAQGYSHPAWLVERWQKRWGQEPTEKLLQWNNQPAPVYARINRLRTDAPTLTTAWEKEGLQFEPATFDWVGPEEIYLLKSPPALMNLESFRRGLFFVQDPGTLLAPTEMGARPGENILDVCAAPGGKTSVLAQAMENRGRIVAEDNQPARLSLVRENAARLGLTCVEPAMPGKEENFDRILVDAPCSNTGVMRRRVDLRWRIQEAEIVNMSVAQLALLHLAAGRLKAGGVLVYSTCSLEPEENEAVTRQFLAEHTDFALDRSRQLVPMIDKVDGAYVARLTKTG
jgi:16S rRNA (cytosine967-C5)-methyltransferase